MTISLDTPAAIGHWYWASAVSQLTFEINTGRNWYGKRSAYTGIRTNMIPGLPARATMVNKLIALATLVEEQPAGPVVDNARVALAAKCDELGLELTRA